MESYAYYDKTYVHHKKCPVVTTFCNRPKNATVLLRSLHVFACQCIQKPAALNVITNKNPLKWPKEYVQ